MLTLVDKVERFFLRIARRILPYSNNYINVVSGTELNETIRLALASSRPFMACRFGSTEFEIFSYDYSMRLPLAERYRMFIEQKIDVVHPFATSISQQYAKRHSIWPGNNVLPDFDIKALKAIQTIAGEKAPFNDWFQALDYMKAQMDAIEYDVAIIGCGAYGFHLAAHAKRTGHQAIHLGGATRILFGIKGKRWDSIPEVSKFYNDSWVYPMPEETPKNNAQVEGGCYW